MDIPKIKEHLEKRLVEIEKELSHLAKEDPFADPDHTRDNAASDTDASEQSSHLRVESLEDALNDEKRRIKDTLIRMDNDSYGKCLRCGNLIEKKRLEILPTSRYCMRCKKKT